jgi:transposase InsO family protein
MILLLGLGVFLRGLVVGRAALALENVALRHQLAALQRSVGRPRLRRRDRIVWAWLARLWPAWRSSLLMVEPATVLAWQRRGFQLYWRWKSWGRPAGRPPLDQSLRELIRRMARENPTWGRRRIQAELALLGYTVGALTVGKYMRRGSPRPSPTWRAFLAAQLGDMVAIDFFIVPTLTCRLLFAFVVLRHDRRELLHVNVTDHPTAAWAARQIVAALPGAPAPAYLLRDRDSVYGEEFQRCLAELGIRQILIAPRAPWQNPFAERVIGSIRRECLDHVVVLGERHLRRRLRAYQRYYNTARPHQALANNSPQPRDVQPPVLGRIVAVPQVGGLHHRYQRAA